MHVYAVKLFHKNKQSFPFLQHKSQNVEAFRSLGRICPFGREKNLENEVNNVLF